MGGRAAEELVLKETTTGAGNDIERATDMARKMICEWGMSENLGPLTFGQKEEQIFLGREFAQHRDYSEETAVRIDKEITRLVSDAYDRAKNILVENMDTLHALAQTLLERETLVESDIDAILEGKTPPAPGKPSKENTETQEQRDEEETGDENKPVPGETDDGIDSES
jgi:cell division protease FtsH